MDHNILYIIGTFFISMGCGFVAIPLIVKFCKKKELYDHPDQRKVHKCSVPRLGGICFIPSMLISSVIMVSVFNQNVVNNEITISLWSVYFFVSLMLVYGVGLIDDIVSLRPLTKLVVQVIAASLLPAASLYINNMYGFLGIHEIPYWVGAPLTVLVIVFIDNAMNLIDGIDGLSAGLSLIALAGFLFCFAREGVVTYSILIAGLMGVLVSFLYFNLFGDRHKRGLKIFMGDSGSLTLGFILGFLFVKFSMFNPSVMPFRKDSLMLSCTLLAIPILDVCRIVIVRMLHRKPLFGADKNHIHHKLMRAGLSQHQALATVLLLALLFIAANYIVFGLMYFSMIVVMDIAIWLVFHAVVDVFIRRRGQAVFSNGTDNG